MPKRRDDVIKNNKTWYVFSFLILPLKNNKNKLKTKRPTQTQSIVGEP